MFDLPVRTGCSRCGSPGPMARQKGRPGGLSSWCLACKREACRRHGRTPRGIATQMWDNIVRRVENRDGLHPAYSAVRLLVAKDVFIRWAARAVRRWLTRHPGGRPSVDRKDSAGHYAAGNLRIVSLGQNNRTKRSVKNVSPPRGKAWCSGKCKAYLDVTAFHKNSSEAHGYQAACASCMNEARRAWRHKRREHAKSTAPVQTDG